MSEIKHPGYEYATFNLSLELEHAETAGYPREKIQRAANRHAVDGWRMIDTFRDEDDILMTFERVKRNPWVEQKRPDEWDAWNREFGLDGHWDGR